MDERFRIRLIHRVAWGHRLPLPLRLCVSTSQLRAGICRRQHCDLSFRADLYISELYSKKISSLLLESPRLSGGKVFIPQGSHLRASDSEAEVGDADEVDLLLLSRSC